MQWYNFLTMQIATVTSKRQLTIPSKIFKKAGVRIGEKVIVQEVEGGLLIKPAMRLVEELGGSVFVPKNLRGADIDKAVEIAKERYFRQKWQRPSK